MKKSLCINTTAGSTTINQETVRKENDTMLQKTTGAEDTLETNRKTLVRKFLYQRKKNFNFKKIGTVGTWEGKGLDEEQDKEIQEFKASYNNWIYTCYDIKGRTYIKFIHYNSLEQYNRVPDEFELVDSIWLNMVDAREISLNNVKYIIRNEEVNYLKLSKVKKSMLRV